MSVVAPVCDATPQAVAEAARLLREGRLVAFPTETVYGLGADAGNDRAIAAVFAAKGRPRFNPLIIHVADVGEADALVVLDDRARRLAAHWWPGPLTLVLPRRADARVSLLASAGLDTLAVRAPDHPVAKALLAAAGPLAAPSANPSGAVSPTTAAHVVGDLGERVALILDGGACRIGIESTVVDLCGPQAALLRPGAVDEGAIAAVIGPLAAAPAGGPRRAPGMLARHYAPQRPLRLQADRARPGEALLAFGPGHPEAPLNLSTAGDLEEAAAHLFAMLRQLDRPPHTAIAVAPVPDSGLGRAINDRLRRAAAPAETAPDADWHDDRGPAAPCRLPDVNDDSA